MDKNSNALNWFEISTLDIQSSVKFYEAVFAIKFEPVSEMGGYQMAMFPAGEGKVGGALIQGEHRTPGKDGSLIYLNANPSIKATSDRIEANGGKILMGPMEISPEIGWMTVFIDNQGNCVAMHANKL
jgi:uncharacterized protein